MGFWKNKSEKLDSKLIAHPVLSKPQGHAAPSPASFIAQTPNFDRQAPITPAISEVSAQGDALTARFGKLRAAIGRGTSIEGNLSFDSPIQIDGRLKGRLSSSSMVIISRDGELDGEIEAASVVVEGRLGGQVRARDRVEILPGGQIEGEAHTGCLVVHEGARFDGTCSRAS